MWLTFCSLGVMDTPQQFLERYLRGRAAAYAHANIHLRQLHSQYFGDPLINRASDFLMRESFDVVFESQTKCDEEVVVTTRETAKRILELRHRYHLVAVDESWRIVRIEFGCFMCQASGVFAGTSCSKCKGSGWYDPRDNAA